MNSVRLAIFSFASLKTELESNDDSKQLFALDVGRSTILLLAVWSDLVWAVSFVEVESVPLW
jgi:hypothetical protein